MKFHEWKIQVKQHHLDNSFLKVLFTQWNVAITPSSIFKETRQQNNQKHMVTWESQIILEAGDEKKNKNKKTKKVKRKKNICLYWRFICIKSLKYQCMHLFWKAPSHQKSFFPYKYYPTFFSAFHLSSHHSSVCLHHFLLLPFTIIQHDYSNTNWLLDRLYSLWKCLDFNFFCSFAIDFILQNETWTEKDTRRNQLSMTLQ